MVQFSGGRSKQEWAIATYADDCWSEPHWGKFGWTRLLLVELPLDLVEEFLAES